MKDIAGLVVMYRDSSTELDALKVVHDRLRWTMSDIYSRDRGRRLYVVDWSLPPIQPV